MPAKFLRVAAAIPSLLRRKRVSPFSMSPIKHGFIRKTRFTWKSRYAHLSEERRDLSEAGSRGRRRLSIITRSQLAATVYRGHLIGRRDSLRETRLQFCIRPAFSRFSFISAYL